MTTVPLMAPERARDLIAAAKQAGVYKTFLNALQASGLAATLEGAGPFTVFAPTDHAFEKFPTATMDKLMAADQRALLRSVLGYHFAVGQVKAARFAGKKIRAKTFDGRDLIIDGVGGVRVNGAKLIHPDIFADNGVLHGIDRVLWPEVAAAPAV